MATTRGVSETVLGETPAVRSTRNPVSVQPHFPRVRDAGFGGLILDVELRPRLFGFSTDKEFGENNDSPKRRGEDQNLLLPDVDELDPSDLLLQLGLVLYFGEAREKP